MVTGRNVESVGQFFHAYLQNPFYSWVGSMVNTTHKWPRKEDRLKKTTKIDRQKTTIKDAATTTTTSTTVTPTYACNICEKNQKIHQNSLFTDRNDVGDFERRSSSHFMFDRVTSVLPTRSTTVDYHVELKHQKWNFNVSISGSTDVSELNSTKTNEVYVHNKTDISFITTDSFLPKVFNETFDYGNYTNITNWNIASEYDTNSNSTSTVVTDDPVQLAAMVLTAFVLGLVILATVIGNVFVIAAILLERNLQNVANYLILSLAVADLLVACLVMPLSAVYEVSQQWTLGPELCDMWTSSDVLCCTASILHLVAIALDRYWAVTNIDYIHQRTAKRIGLMIVVIWGVAFFVCIAPMAGWKDPGWEDRIFKNQTCIVSQDVGYQVFATSSSFYVPLLVILILYWRIFQTARKRIRRRGNPGGVGGAPPRNPAAGGVVAGAAGGSGGIAAAVVAVIGRPLPTISETTTAFTTVSSTNTSPEKQPLGNGVEPDLPTADCLSSYQQTLPYPIPVKRKTKEAADSKRERKAAKTLAIITGAFVVCWLPFFIVAILSPVCETCKFNPIMMSFFLWLGYFNSTLNPIIYTIFSPEFRHAFKRLLCGRRGSIRRRNVRHFGARHFQ